MSELPVERLVFLDESGVTTKMARTHARAPRGQRAYGSIPLGSWQRSDRDVHRADGQVFTGSVDSRRLPCRTPIGDTLGWLGAIGRRADQPTFRKQGWTHKMLQKLSKT